VRLLRVGDEWEFCFEFSKMSMIRLEVVSTEKRHCLFFI
jgi:hypothetical protein